MSIAAPIPARVDAATKQALLDLLGHAVGQGWPLGKACGVLGLDVRRARRAGTGAGLVDTRPGGSVNALMPAEVEAIVSAFETYGVKDFFHLRLAHRDSYEGLFWAGPSTVRRVLNGHDLRFRHPPAPPRGQRRPLPDWASYTPNSIWIYDSTHFTRCGMTALFIEDLVSRKWITTVVPAEETHTQVRLGFEQALDAEGLLEAALERAGDIEAALAGEDPDEVTPILLAVSDNGGSQMISANTRRFMAMVAIAQHFGRPATPTDQAWIESLNGTVKIEWPYLHQITDPAVLRVELWKVGSGVGEGLSATVEVQAVTANKAETPTTDAQARRLMNASRVWEWAIRSLCHARDPPSEGVQAVHPYLWTTRPRQEQKSPTRAIHAA